MVTPRRIIVAVTVLSLTAAMVVNAVWFVRSTGSGRFEPVVGVLGILAGITGLVAERWAAAREARDAAVAAISAELHDNQRTLADPAFGGPDQPLHRRVFPRLHMSAVDAAFASSALSSSRDAALIEGLHAWRNEVVRFNAQLSMAEVLVFTGESDAAILRDIRDGLHDPSGPLAQLPAAIADLVTELASAR